METIYGHVAIANTRTETINTQTETIYSDAA